MLIFLSPSKTSDSFYSCYYYYYYCYIDYKFVWTPAFKKLLYIEEFYYVDEPILKVEVNSWNLIIFCYKSVLFKLIAYKSSSCLPID